MIGSKIIKIETLDSTNLYLQRALKDQEIEEGTLVIANEQTQGRGQRDNRWESKKGANLTFSFVLYPKNLHASDQFILSKLVSLALCDFLKLFLHDVRIKWPNDIYIKKKKIAGVLIENVISGSHISSSVIGIGMNINQGSFRPGLPFATSLRIETGTNYALDNLLEQLRECLNERFDEYVSGNISKIHHEYLITLYQYMELRQYQSNNMNFTAKITGIDDDGRLCLLTEDNDLLKFAFKEISFL
jgi:BirA family transcriptional regulator, biotin operon repressor / biotin---[acetyl-CoA-carboxylase] ligase